MYYYESSGCHLRIEVLESRPHRSVKIAVDVHQAKLRTFTYGGCCLRKIARHVHDIRFTNQGANGLQ